MSRIKIIALWVWTFCCTLGVYADSDVATKNLFEVSLAGRPIIYAGSIGDVDFEKTVVKESLEISTTSEEAVVKGYLETSKQPERAEITLYVKFPSSRYGKPGVKYEKIIYTLRLSEELMNGAKVVAHHSPGRGNPGERVEVDLNKEGLDSGLLQGGIYFLEIEDRSGNYVTFDFESFGASFRVPRLFARHVRTWSQRLAFGAG